MNDETKKHLVENGVRWAKNLLIDVMTYSHGGKLLTPKARQALRDALSNLDEPELVNATLHKP